MQASRGIVNVTIISAEELKKAQAEKITAAVGKLVGTGKKVEVRTEINPAILAGLQVMIGDKFLDLSAASRISEVSKALESTM